MNRGVLWGRPRPGSGSRAIDGWMKFYYFFRILLFIFCIIVCMVVCFVWFYLYYIFLLLYLCIFLCIFRSRICVSLCCSVYCLCVTVYCTNATGCQPNCSWQMYHKISHTKLQISVCSSCTAPSVIYTTLNETDSKFVMARHSGSSRRRLIPVCEKNIERY